MDDLNDKTYTVTFDSDDGFPPFQKVLVKYDEDINPANLMAAGLLQYDVPFKDGY